jgi:beta-lactamase regulating signal transducer with metallopeptidase domain
MIAAFMLYATLVAVICAAAAWLAERACAHLGGARRLPWAIGMIVSVAIPLASLAPPEIGAGAAGGVAAVAAAPATSPPTTIFNVAVARIPARPALDSGLAIAWAGLSAAILAIYLLSAWRLWRRARHWPTLQFDRGQVWIAEDLGPAVFGLLRNRVILPRWMVTAPQTTLRLALAHERQHASARDPALHAAALALVMVFPWNLALLWQMRRLRFALEVDCDARVLSLGTDPAEYGEALLAVSQRESQAPAGAIALIERASQLERRIDIMTTTAHRHRAWIATASLVLSGACVFAAAAVEAPSGAYAPLKPAPTGGNAFKLGRHFEEMLVTRYPGLLEQDRAGTAAVVLLLNEDWSIAKAAQVNFEESMEKIELKEGVFGVLGIAEDAVPYVGTLGIQSPHNSAHRVLVVFTESSTPGERFVSRVAMDFRPVDREIFQYYFPKALKEGTPAGQGFWVLVDRGGQVLRSGQESFDSSGWNKALEARFGGIRTQEVTLTPITDAAGEPLKDAAGKDLQLYSVWLAPGSPPPVR